MQWRSKQFTRQKSTSEKQQQPLAMAPIQRLFSTLQCIILSISISQLLMIVDSSPLPPKDDANAVRYNSSVANSSSGGADCRINGTVGYSCNVTKFLSKWLSPSQGEAGLSKLTMETEFLISLTDNKEVST